MKKISAHIKKIPLKQVKIDTDFIKLDAFLKLCGAVMTGGHAKSVILDGEVVFFHTSFLTARHAISF